MKHIDINSSTYNDFDVEIKEKMEILNLKLMIIKYKNIFAKGYTTNLSKDVLVIKKVKTIVLWTYVIKVFNGEETKKKK